jgi:hypothetical protein
MLMVESEMPEAFCEPQKKIFFSNSFRLNGEWRVRSWKSFVDDKYFMLEKARGYEGGAIKKGENFMNTFNIT